MEGLGSYLKRERELRQISLDDLSHQTCIQKCFLQAIESEHFEKLPSLIYAKGFLRSYAESIGIDSNDIVLRFEGIVQKIDLAGQSRAKNKKQTLIVGTLVLAMLVFTFILLKF